MDIRKYPQFHLYLLTLNMLTLKSQLLPDNCDDRCVNSTIINRAYYSAYLYCELWLEKVKQFKTTKPWKIKKPKDRHSEHKQVRLALMNKFDEKEVSNTLEKLALLRSKADYKPFEEIKLKEVEDAVSLMKKIFNDLKFE